MARDWPQEAADRGRETAGSCSCGMRTAQSRCMPLWGIRGLTEAQKASLRALGALENEADEESSRPEQAAEL